MRRGTTASGGPLRVLMVVQRLLPFLAGAEIQALNLAAALASAGVHVSFVASRYAPGPAAKGTIRGFAVRRLPALGGPFRRPSQIAATAGWVALWARRFDVVHAHGLVPASLGAVIGARVAGVPVLVKPTLGGPDGEIARLRSGPARTLLPLLRLVTRFPVLKPSVGSELEAIGMPRSRIVLVNNGVDSQRFRPASPEERDALRARLGLPGGPLVLFAAQLIERKGVVETLEAWRLVSATRPDGCLLVAGDGPLEGHVRKAAAESGARVRYLGFVEDVASLMRASDVFVGPSRNEAFHNSLAEALACGLPVVTGSEGIAASLPLDASAAHLVDPRSSTEIAAALSGMLASGASHAVAGPAAVGRFEFAGVAAAYIDLYRKLIARGDPWRVVRRTRLS